MSLRDTKNLTNKSYALVEQFEDSFKVVETGNDFEALSKKCNELNSNPFAQGSFTVSEISAKIVESSIDKIWRPL